MSGMDHTIPPEVLNINKMSKIQGGNRVFPILVLDLAELDELDWSI